MSSLLHPRTLTEAMEKQMPALLGSEQASLSHSALREQCTYVASCLARAGVASSDRVAIVLPNGPEMAAAFLGVASVCAAAPLNPAYREQELDFYLGDLQPSALLVDPALDSPAAAIARARGIAVLALGRQAGAAAGRFELDIDAAYAGPLPPAGASDTALILHTSGTTSRPKMVALTQANLAASARHIATTLQLRASDRCLNIMPLFHIHGLIAGLLSSLHAGGSVVCTPGFEPARFFDWLAQARPTWITAVPTMYGAIAQLASQHRERVRASGLRLLRSSSASLPPQLMAALEDAFAIPVIEAYGMTEAAHQMASNPLPPAARKPGSVGLPAGPEITILDPREPRQLPRGATGEIAIRGPNVTTGYVANPEANRGAFSEGWFRTGDQGYIDADGYLFISGRLKELINRGGEKISPREVDEALLAIPGVQQAVAFAVPHATLGEDVAAAVVLAPGATLGEDDARARLRERLAPFKVPARIVFVDAIPKGPTGKLQRIGLADKLAEQLADRYVAPRNDTERALVAIWEEVLEAPRIGIESNFFALGGDSLRAVRITSLAAAAGLAVAIDAVFREPTIARLAAHVRPIESFATADEHRHGPVRLYGFQRVVLQSASARPERFSALSEAVFDLPGAVDRSAIERAITALAQRHDAFSLRFEREGSRWHMHYQPLPEGWLAEAVQSCDGARFTAEVKAAHERFELARPPLFKLVYSTGAPARIAIVAHHLVADAMSMQIVAEDFALAYRQALAGEPIALPAVPTPLTSFLRRYEAASRAGRFHADAGEWLARSGAAAEPSLLVSRPSWTGLTVLGSMRHAPIDFGEHSARVLAHARAHDVAPRDMLLAASAAALREASERDRLGILLMSSGRDQPLLGDLSRTVGCLANLVPLVLELGDARALEPIRAVVQDAVARLPSSGFSLPAVLSSEPSETRLRVAKLLFDSQLFINYKGVLGPRSPLGPSSTALRAAPCTFAIETMMTQLQSPEDPIPACLALQIHYEIVGDSLVGDLYYSSDLYEEPWIGRLVDGLVRCL
jgi:acyl-CoA synthetase (AMP-forming)/AMP-acid ligase II